MTAVIILLIVFGLFGWYLYVTLRYTAMTVGDESPLRVPVTYSVTAIQYLTRFYFIFLVIGVLFCSWVFYILLRYAPMPKTPQEWLIACVCYSLFPLLFYTFFIILQLEYQYARITIDVEVSLEPATKSVRVSKADDTVEFVASDLEEIEHHVPTNYKSPYRYYIFKLKDGRRVYLNDSSVYLDFTLEAYFKQVPVRYFEHSIPWIKA